MVKALLVIGYLILIINSIIFAIKSVISLLHKAKKYLKIYFEKANCYLFLSLLNMSFAGIFYALHKHDLSIYYLVLISYVLTILLLQDIALKKQKESVKNK